MNLFYRKKRLSLVFLGTLLFALIGSFQAMAQPNSTYTLKSGGGSVTLTAANASNTNGACYNGTNNWTLYGFNGSFSTYTANSCGIGCVLGTSIKTTSVSPGSVGSVQTVNYSQMPITLYSSPCSTSPGSSSTISTTTITTYADLTATGGFPSQVCINGGSINLSSYISISAALASGVSYKLDGSSTSSTLSPSGLSAGSHTITASYGFDNGTTTVTVGTFTAVAPVSSVGSPSSQSICGSGTANFSASASGSGISYQWYESANGGASYSALSNAGVYSGVTSSTMSITNPGTGYNGRLYKCYINDQNSCNPTYTSAATLTVYGQVGITTSPSPQSVCAGTSASFSAGATPNSGSISYTWQVSTNGGATWSNQGGVSSTLTLSGVTTAMNGYYYRCYVQDACGAVNGNTTSSAKLTVYGGPSITSQPSSQSFCNGGSVSLSVGASASTGSLGYQWQYWTGSSWSNVSNSANISGATTASLSWTGLSSTYSGYILRCQVNDGCGGSDYAYSNNATITMYPLVSITSQPSSTSVCPTGGATFSVAASLGTGSASYQWAVSTDGGTTWSNLSNGGVYSGVTSSSLGITGATAAMSGYKYRCTVQDGCGAPSQAVSSAATLTIYGSSTITSQPVSSNYCLNGNASFTVAATAVTGSLAYQWQVSSDGGATWTSLSNAGIYSNTTTATLNITAATAANNGYKYRVQLHDACSANVVTSSVATLTQYANVSITTQPTSSSICPTGNTSFSLAATAANGSATYQWAQSVDGGTTWTNVTNAGVFSGATTATLSITGATLSMTGYKYKCTIQDGCGAVSQAVSNVVTLTVFGAPTISSQPVNATFCTNGNASFTVGATASSGSLTYQWQVSTDGGTTWTNLTNIAVYSGTTTATLSLTSITASYNSYKYRVILQDACTANSTTSNVATLAQSPAVVINIQPVNMNVCPSGSTSMTVGATPGNGSANYQWSVSTDLGATFTNVANTGIYSGANTATLNFASVTNTYNNYLYKVLVGDACGAVSQATSSNAKLTVFAPPSITTQPVNTSFCLNGNATMFVVAAASNGSLSYQWQVSTDNGATWNNISNAGIYNGATTATLTFTSVTSVYSGYKYRAIIQDGCGAGNSNTTNVVTLSQYANVSITSQPTNKSICPSTSTTFGVAATAANGGATFQWAVSTDNGSTWSNVANTGVYSGATSPTLSITSAPLSMNNYLYRVTVQDGCGAISQAVSSNAKLTVYSSPTITAQPVNTKFCLNGNASISVTATASNGTLGYQWQVSTDGGTTWVNISDVSVYTGSATSTLTLTGVTATYSGYKYRVILQDACGAGNSTTSSVVTLTQYANVAITTQPANSGICPSSGTTFSVVATTSNGVATYQWQVSTNGGSTYSNVTNGGNYSGATSSTLTLASITSAFNNYKYKVIVSDGCGAVSQATSNVATLTVYTGASITSQPTNSTICQGTSTSFTVGAVASNGSLTYQWYVNPNNGTWTALTATSVYTGVTSGTLSLTNPPNSYANYTYHVIVSDACSGITVQSNDAALKFFGILAATAPTNQVACPNASASFTVSATANTGSLSYQWQLSTDNGSTFANVPATAPYGSSGTTATLNISSAPLSMNGYQYKVIVSDGCGASTKYTSPAVSLTVNNTVAITTDLPVSTSVCVNAALTLTTVDTGTGLTFQWQENQGTGWTNLTNIGIYSGVTTNALTLSTVPTSYGGYQYRLQITGTCSSATSVTTTLSVVQPPTISTNPLVSQTVCQQTGATITGAATGTSPTYQWLFSATGNSGTFSNITGATSATYAISSAALTDAGYYQLTATNSCGFNTSSTGQLTVNPITSIGTQPSDATVCPTFSKSFTVVAAGTPSYTYQWWSDGNVGSWGTINGATSATYTVTNATTANAGNYKVVVTGACGASVTSNTVKLTVNPVPAQPSVNDQSRCGDGAISATATSSSPSPTYNWYANLGDVTPVSTGATYNIANLTTNSSYYATVVSLGCESSQKQVNFGHIAPTSVNIGVDKTLCSGQGLYDLSKDIVTSNGTGGQFTWTANSTNFSGNNFDPSVGAGTYLVTYTPTTAEQGTPTCYIPTTRNITVTNSSGTGGITFTGTNVNNGNTINSCVGDSPINLSSIVNIAGGTWGTVTGSGISSSGSNSYFTATTNNYTATSPNAFSYTVNVNGCTGTNTLYIYVKNNTTAPTVTGVPASSCPGTQLSIGANVTQVGTYSYQWYAPGATTNFATGSTLKYTVIKDTTLFVRSLDQSFGCLSPATQVSISTPFKAGVIQVDKSTLQAGDFVKFTFSGGAIGNSFSWDFGDAWTSHEQNPVHYFYKIGTYTAKLTVNSTVGCNTSLSFSPINVLGKPDSVQTAVTDFSNGEKNSVQLYPNPANGDQVTVESADDIIAYRIINTNGVVQDSKVVDATTKLPIDVHQLNPGIYILELSTSRSKAVLKMVKL